MNEVTGSVHCPQCDTLNVSIAAHCSGCGALLGKPVQRDSLATQVLRHPEGPSRPPVAGPPPLQPPDGAAFTGFPEPYTPSYASPPQYPTPQPYEPSPPPPARPTSPSAFETRQLDLHSYGLQPAQPLQPYQPLPPQAYHAQPPQPYYGQPLPPQAYQPPYGPPPGYQGGAPGQPYQAHGYAPPMQAPYGPYPSPYMQPVNVNVSPVINVQTPVTVQVPAPAPAPPPVVVVNTASSGPSMAVRVLWFLFIGLPLGLVSTIIGWALCVAVLTLPLGLGILHSLPAIMTLRPSSKSTQVVFSQGVTIVNTDVAPEQQPFLVRAVYFLLIGWWFSALWLGVAWVLVVLSVVTFGLSLAPAFMMFERVPQVLTLREN